ncbi:nitroreductase family protein [Parasediminibacterium sp. JCM 36343]|uniref:nitroreductase family protein n=1 Tax=Parasediminibacterium sp. JCM 36343 TaxID=3374279 RepID=UPI00397BFBE5
MSLISDLHWRYATKKMNGTKVPQEKVDSILDAIQLAASSFGLQPYTILVIEDQATKEKLVAASYGQPQIAASSHLLVFCAWKEVTQESIDTFIADIAAKRGVPLESLAEYKAYISGSVSHLSKEQQAIWNAKQAYIALGTGLAAAAEAKVDATPMEGFLPAQYDEILGLSAQGLTATVIMPLGYRDESDWLSNLPKVRRDKDLLFKFI